MVIKFFISTIFIFIFSSAYNQDIKYAKQILDTLCSENYHGRGYAFEADKKAANFIVKEFEKYDLRKFKRNYKQKFNISVNTFPLENSLMIGDSLMVPGRDFLTSSFSSSISGKYELLKLTPEVLNDKYKFKQIVNSDLSDKVILIDTLGLNNPEFKIDYKLIVNDNVLKAKAVIIISDKNLMYVPSQIQKDFTQIILRREKYNKKFNTVSLNIRNKYLEKYNTQNLVSYIKGQSDTFIVFSAHYDHIGHNGKDAFFPGANDNGSGVAMVLNIAKYFSELKQKPKYSIAFMFFSGEELGLLGSKYYTENPLFPLKKIKFLINLDMVGSGDKGIQIVNGSVFKNEFDKIVGINNNKNYLPKIKIRGAAANSDHYFFYANGVKSFFIYTLGQYKEYHNIYDKPDILPLNKFEELFKLLIDFCEQI